jgi:DNA-binding PadR family transcriptional regulator
MDLSSELTKGSIVPIVLQLLSDRPMYGYEMVKVVDARTDGRLQWKEGTLYPVLHRLEAEGLVKARWKAASDGAGAGRKRKYYSLTRRGTAERKRRTRQWKEFSFAVNAILAGGA